MTTPESASASEHLTDGWEVDTPVDDTLLRQSVYAFADCVAALVGHGGGTVERRPGLIAADLGYPATYNNICVLTQPVRVGDLPQLAQFMEDFFFGPGKSGMVVLVNPWPEPEFSLYGWNLMGHPPAHIRPQGGVPPGAPPGFTIEDVTRLPALFEWERVAVEGYPLDEMLPWQAGALVNDALLADPRARFWLARINGQAVGCASTFIEHGINYVSLVATMPEARGRGIGSALTWRATLADPTLPAMLLSSDEGRPVYARMGYLPIARLTLWYRLR